MPTAYDIIGAHKLRAVIEEFYERVFADVMIGFLFFGKDKERLVQLEWELAAGFLGAKDVTYTGRAMRVAHAKSPILGGHFERRLQILKETMADLGVAEVVQQTWIKHTLALRPQVTADAGSECDHDLAADRLKSSDD